MPHVIVITSFNLRPCYGHVRRKAALKFGHYNIKIRNNLMINIRYRIIGIFGTEFDFISLFSGENKMRRLH